MASRAGNRVIGGKAGVVIQIATQFRLCRRIWIAFWPIDARETQRFSGRLFPSPCPKTKGRKRNRRGPLREFVHYFFVSPWMNTALYPPTEASVPFTSTM